MANKLFISLFLFLAFSAPPHASAQELPFQIGGTNFVVYELGRYGTNPSLANYTFDENDPGAIRMVLKSYDKDTEKIRHTLMSMCHCGQKKIGLVMWFFPFNANDPDRTKRGAFDSASGQLEPRFLKNTIDTIKTINEMKKDGEHCFNEVQLRFASLGPVDPSSWTEWYEDRYTQNRSFIFTTIRTVNAALPNPNLKIYYNIGAELGGKPLGQVKTYTQRLWRDYLGQFGNNNTYGFDIAWHPGRFKELMQAYDVVGERPKSHAATIYSWPHNKTIDTQLKEIYQEMQETGEANSPLLIQETYANDAQAFAEIRKGIQETGTKVRSVMLWQLERDKFIRPDGGRGGWSTIGIRYDNIECKWPSPSPIAKPGDLNEDGRVDILDFNLLVRNFGNPYTIFDFNALVANFGK